MISKVSKSIPLIISNILASLLVFFYFLFSFHQCPFKGHLKFLVAKSLDVKLYQLNQLFWMFIFTYVTFYSHIFKIFLTLISSTDNHVNFHLCMSVPFHQWLVSFCLVKNPALSKGKSGLCPQFLAYLMKTSLCMVGAGHTWSQGGAGHIRQSQRQGWPL